MCGYTMNGIEYVTVKLSDIVLGESFQEQFETC